VEESEMKIYVGHLSERERFEHDLARDPGSLGVYSEDERSDGQIAEDAELDELQGPVEDCGDIQADRLAMFRREY
jgi:hypothetical protein